MNRCEDYPACGHGPVPYGDGGGCPDSEGRFNCVNCGAKLPSDWPSALCKNCRSEDAHDVDEEGGHSPECRGCRNEDALWETVCEWETENHDKHTELAQFVEACDVCQGIGYNKDTMSDILYITPDASIKAYKNKEMER